MQHQAGSGQGLSYSPPSYWYAGYITWDQFKGVVAEFNAIVRKQDCSNPPAAGCTSPRELHDVQPGEVDLGYITAGPEARMTGPGQCHFGGNVGNMYAIQTTL